MGGGRDCRVGCQEDPSPARFLYFTSVHAIFSMHLGSEDLNCFHVSLILFPPSKRCFDRFVTKFSLESEQMAKCNSNFNVRIQRCAGSQWSCTKPGSDDGLRLFSARHLAFNIVLGLLESGMNDSTWTWMKSPAVPTD